MSVLLLDRDGTLMVDVGYPNDPARVRLIPGAASSMRELARAGFRLAIVSNQSGLSRGLITYDQYRAVHEQFNQLFERASGQSIPAFYCLHGVDEGCDCRKPKPGLLTQALRELGLENQPVVMIGDKPSDVAAGIAIGAKTVWLSFGREYPANEPAPDFIAEDWTAAKNWLLMRG
ncbi:MAG: HAD-IIIA family hydrolase [Gemmataceae bacterium]